MQTVEQQDLIFFELHRFGGETSTFFKAVNGFFDDFTLEQSLEMAIEQLDVESFRRLVVAIVDPIGRVLNERPKIVVEVEHEKTQPLFLEPFGEFYCRRRFSR